MDEDDIAPKPKKKKKGKKLFLILILLLLLGGGGGGAFYGMQAGWFGAAAGAADHGSGYELVPREHQRRVTGTGDEGEGEGEGGHGGGGGGGSGRPTPRGNGGDQYASNYYAMEREFTSNLQDSVHFIQVALAVSTPYDERVIENLRTHEIAVRSAILLALGESAEDEVFTVEGKRRIQQRLVRAINAVLQQKEGFGGISNVYFTNFIVQ